MPLIIEGPDHVGKTTAAHRIVELMEQESPYPAYYAHMSRPPDSWDYFHHYVQRMQPYAVQDRFHIGGLIYADRFRGGTPIGPERLRMLEAHLALMGSYTVILCGNPVWYRDQLKTHPKAEMYKADDLVHVNDDFLTAQVKYPNLHIDDVHIIDGEFPEDDVLRRWVHGWIKRLDAAKALEGQK